jgi:hypothetical protein
MRGWWLWWLWWLNESQPTTLTSGAGAPQNSIVSLQGLTHPLQPAAAGSPPAPGSASAADAAAPADGITSSLDIDFAGSVVRRGVIDAQVRGSIMRMAVSLDDDLLAQAELLCADLERSALLKEALRALVQRESAKRLAALGGSEPELKPIPRRRSAA